MTRRRLLRQMTALLATGSASASANKGSGQLQLRVPDESEVHERTWMAFPSDAGIWGAGLQAVQGDIVRIASAIALFEPVTLLVNRDALERARSLLSAQPQAARVTLLESRHDDLWIRDTGPIFVRQSAGDEPLRAIDANFNGWGGKQTHARDREVAVLVAAGAMAPRHVLDAVLEGGALECDGQGTALIKESCVLNPNRNPGIPKAQMQARLQRAFGLDKIIWLPGPAGGDITDGHTDFYARFVSPSRVVVSHDVRDTYGEREVTQAIIDVLRQATDAKGRRLQIDIIATPASPASPDAGSQAFAASYINYYTVNGGVLMPLFGDAQADRAARQTLARLFPERRVQALRIDALAAGGGGIHCATLHQPKTN